jgi:hypothetical protein
MSMIYKTATVSLFLITLITAEAKLTNEESDGAIDEKYQALIIGRWVEDKDKQQQYDYPIYVEYYADGSSVGKIFDEVTCKEFLVLKGYWKISNGYLYYKSDGDVEWSLDRIIKMTGTHHVLRSKGETLYRKKGTVCDE